MILNINTSAVVIFTNKLEKMHRSALPNAVRDTLNSAAFDVKQHTMLASADKFFEKRNPNFFRANSRVQKATGWDLKGMKAIVGFTPHTAQYNNEAVQELQQQEHGGTIDDRDFIPMDEARSGGNATAVRPMNRLNKIRSQVGSLKNIVDASRGTKRQFVQKAMTVGAQNTSLNKSGSRSVVNGFIIGGMHGKKTLYRVNAIHRISRNTQVKVTPIYSFKKGRKVGIDEDTHFMQEASLKSAKKLNQFFIKEANRQFAKIKR